jgi:ABC-type nitrate/sulfonate/bicarbonate transport system substrate-binding protein
MTRNRLVVLVLAILLIGLAIGIATWTTHSSSPIRYGISPFQDTAMPVVAEDLGLYKKAGLDVELRTVAWEDIVPSVASAGHTIDVGIGSINLFLPRAENIDVKGGGDVVFYFPLYVFKGASLVARKELSLLPLDQCLSRASGDKHAGLALAAKQLQGLRVGVPKGTPYEQMLFALLKEAGMDPNKDIQRRDVKLADALPALLRGDLDVIGAGVTQRTEAARHGHSAVVDMEGMGFAEIIGLVTTEHFAKTHPKELGKLTHVWFDSVHTLFSDVPRYSTGVLRYLSQNASTRYSLKEYQESLKLQEFPRSVEEARALMMRPDGRFYWKRTWDIVNDYLLASGSQQQPIPYKYFWGNRIPENF